MTAVDSAATGRAAAGKAATCQVLLIGKDPRLGKELEEGLTARNCVFDYAAGSCDALRRLRQTHYAVVITDPATHIDEDLALLAEMRAIRPGVRAIVLASDGTPEEIIAALRARVFICLVGAVDAAEIANYAMQAANSLDSLVGIEVLSAQRNWVSVRMNCHLLSAERLVVFLKGLQLELPDVPRDELMMAFREILMNAIEHGAEFCPGKVIDVAAVHTARAIVFYVHDPGPGFRWEGMAHAAITNPPEDPVRHACVREEKGMRPGGFGILIAKGIVDELIYSEVGNEVLLIKHVA